MKNLKKLKKILIGVLINYLNMQMKIGLNAGKNNIKKLTRN